MIDYFSPLIEDEEEVMYRVPILISILKAGADDIYYIREIKLTDGLAVIKHPAKANS